MIRQSLASCFLLFQVATVFAQSSTAVEKPDLKIGDRWVYRSMDLWKNEETEKYEYKITGVNGDNIELSRTTLASKTESEVGRVSTRKADRSTWTLIDARIVEGEVIVLAFPLEIGKTWKYEYSGTTRSGNHAVRKLNAKVEALEVIQVPAGQFKTLKVVHSGTYTSQGARGTTSGSLFQTYWYSPDLKRVIKQEYRETTGNGRIWDQTRDELVEHELK